MSKFKVGDKVKVIEAPLNFEKHLLGKVGTIIDIDDTYVYEKLYELDIEDEESVGFWDYELELVKDIPKLTAENIIRRKNQRPIDLVPRRIKPKLIKHIEYNFRVIGEGRRGEVINMVNDKLELLQGEFEIHQVIEYSTTYGDGDFATVVYLTLLVTRR